MRNTIYFNSTHQVYYFTLHFDLFFTITFLFSTLFGRLVIRIEMEPTAEQLIARIEYRQVFFFVYDR